MTRALPRLSLPHLSDEAVAAFADGVLRGAAQQRARQHLSECRDCAEAIHGQRAASAVLRSAAAPSLPLALLDRLRQLPSTAPLPSAFLDPAGMSVDGQPVFAAFGTVWPASAASALLPFAGPPTPAAPAAPAPADAVPPAAVPAGNASAGNASAGDAPAGDAPGGAARRRPVVTSHLTTLALAAVAVGLLVSTAASTGGATAGLPPAGSTGGGVLPGPASIGTTILIRPAAELTGRR